MSDKTHIEWADATWNPVTGCTKVSAGCKHCYAERDWARLSANSATRYYGRAFTDVRCHDDVLPLPLRWSKRRRVFVNSMSDLFHDDIPTDFIDEVFAIMARAERHTFQVLTKRPERMRAYLSDIDLEDRLSDIWREKMWLQDGWSLMLPLSRVWLGVSVEDQATADERIPLLLTTPAAVRWISAEPLLGPVSFRWAKWHDYSRRSPGFSHGHLDGMRGIDWVVVGGESGPNARPMHPAWTRSMRDQCSEAGVPFLFKQHGEWAPRSSCYHTFEDGNSLADLDPDATRWPSIRITESGSNGRDLEHAEEGDHVYMQRVGKKLAGRLLDGVEHNGYPS